MPHVTDDRPNWLPVRQQVMCKVLGLVNQLLAGVALAYLADDCQLLSDLSRRTLWSSVTDVRWLSRGLITRSATEASRVPVLDIGTSFHLNYGSRPCLFRCSDRNWKRYCSTAALSEFLFLTVLYKYSVYVCMYVCTMYACSIIQLWVHSVMCAVQLLMT